MTNHLLARAATRGVRSLVLFMLLLVSAAALSQTPQRSANPQLPIPGPRSVPAEAAGIDGIVEALIAAYDQFDVVALGEMHGRRSDSDLRIALVRHPDFAKKVRT